MKAGIVAMTALVAARALLVSLYAQEAGPAVVRSEGILSARLIRG